MRNLLSIVFFFLLCTNSNAQYKLIKELENLFNSKNYNKTEQLARKYLADHPENPQINLFLGMALTEKEDYSDALHYLEKASYDKFNDADTTRSWALGYLGCCAFMLEGPDEAEVYFERAYKSNGTVHSEKFINKMLLLFGIHEDFDNWIEYRTEHITFWIEDTTNFDIAKYLNEHEKAYTICNSFFRASLPKRIDIFVWDSPNEAKNTLFLDPAFASPRFCCIHSNQNLSPGHEITHILSHFGTPGSIKNDFIFEGIAVAFDQSGFNKEAYVKAFIRQNKIEGLSIVSLWKNNGQYPVALTYPLAGILVERMIDEFGRDRFIEFMQDQSFANALSLFGYKLPELIIEIEQELW